MIDNKEVAIIGLGPGGVSAAIYLSRYGMKPVCFEKELIGGKVNKTERIDNYPGFPLIQGMKLASNFEEQLNQYDIDIIYKEVKNVSLNDDHTFKIRYGRDLTKDFKYVIISTGRREKEVHFAGEDKFHRKGLSSCAICDGALYKDKDVFILGGGNSAFEEGCYLASICKSATIITRRREYRADQFNVKRFLSFNNAKVLSPYEIVSLDGINSLEKITIKNKETQEIESHSLSGLFIYIGEEANTSFLSSLDLKTEEGYIVTDSNMMTSIDNLYAIGDIRNSPLKQVVTATSDGSMAATHIFKEYQSEL